MRNEAAGGIPDGVRRRRWAEDRTADALQRNLIREWLALDPFGEPQRAYRRRCSCGHNRYCGPGCGAHTE